VPVVRAVGGGDDSRVGSVCLGRVFDVCTLVVRRMKGGEEPVASSISC
jgi:hypothetical protein